MPDRSRMRPANPKQLAKRIVAIATGKEGATASTDPLEGKNPAAVALGRLGGLKGGKARAQSLSRKQRADIARRAATARWKNDR
jgi:hypothetical protein